MTRGRIVTDAARRRFLAFTVSGPAAPKVVARRSVDTAARRKIKSEWRFTTFAWHENGRSLDGFYVKGCPGTDLVWVWCGSCAESTEMLLVRPTDALRWWASHRHDDGTEGEIVTEEREQ